MAAFCYRITLGSVFVVILFLNILSGDRARWTNRLCQLNILAIIISLASVKYKVWMSPKYDIDKPKSNSQVLDSVQSSQSHYNPRPLT